MKIKKIESIDYFDLIDQRFNTRTTEQNNMQTQTPTQSDILQQFSDMLKSHSIVVADRANLVKLLENIVDLCTQMPKTKLKAAVKAATKTPAAAKPAAKTPAAKAAKKQPVRETLVGPADAGDCPVMSDLKAPARGRGRPRKADATAVTDNDAEKKKRGRPKKDKTVTISSNDDEDALIAKMIADVKKNAKQSAAVAEPAEEDDDSTESELEEFSGELIRAEENHAEENHAEENHAEETSPVVANSVSPVHQVEPIHSDVPIEVEAEVEAGVVNKSNAKSKQAKEPKVKEPKFKEPKVKEPKVKETKVKETKVKETKVNEPKVKEPKQAIAVEVVPATPVVPVSATSVSATSATPLRENKASSDGNFYLMPNYPRESFTYNGNTYLRTETDNVYDTMTLEMIGVWDHLNHEIITAFDDEEVDELWLSEEE